MPKEDLGTRGGFKVSTIELLVPILSPLHLHMDRMMCHAPFITLLNLKSSHFLNRDKVTREGGDSESHTYLTQPFMNARDDFHPGFDAAQK